MKIQGFKNYLPRKLFSRTILIFLLPIILIEMVIFIAFIQRHFEQVTSQMTEIFTFQVKYLIKSSNRQLNLADYHTNIVKLGKEFDLEISFNKNKPNLVIRNLEIFDFSGRSFVKTMALNFENPIYYDFSKRKKITLAIPINEEFLIISFPRGRISASNPHQFLVLMVFVTVLFVLIALLVLRNQIKPIIKLAEVSDAFGKGQSISFKPSGSDEVRRAGLAFISMRTRIEKQIEQRTKMLSEVSHDLRTPLTRLKLSLALLKDQSEAKEILKDVDSMESMIDGFLLFARSGTIEDFDKINLIDLIEQLCDRNRNRIKNKSIELIIKTEFEKLTCFPIRKNIFERAIQNLVDNALTYGNKIIITLNSNRKFVTITIEDDGPGIAEKNRKEALKPFSRLDNSRNQNTHSGVGLGLSITSDAIRSHGGNLNLGKSNNLGGLSAKIILPV